MSNENIAKPDYRRAAFLTSAPSLKFCPPDFGAEVAFAGRSNAGKSSAINTLTGNKKLARTSKTPGRTQQINFFNISDDQRLVDLPGYGYAKVPPKMKHAWQQSLEQYLRERRSLKGMVLLMDIRHPLKEFDTSMLQWAVQSEMPVRVLLTKADKLKRGAATNTLLSVRKELAPVGHLVTVQLFSALKRDGIKELVEQLDIWMTESLEDESDAPLDSELTEEAEQTDP